MIALPVIDELNFRQYRRQKVCGYSLTYKNRKNRLTEIGGVAVFALTRNGVEGFGVQHKYEDVAVANRRKNSIPPHLSSAQLLIKPHRVAQPFNIINQISGDVFAVAVVADEDLGHG